MTFTTSCRCCCCFKDDECKSVLCWPCYRNMIPTVHFVHTDSTWRFHWMPEFRRVFPTSPVHHRVFCITAQCGGSTSSRFDASCDQELYLAIIYFRQHKLSCGFYPLNLHSFIHWHAHMPHLRPSPVLVHGQVTIIFVVSVGLSVCLSICLFVQSFSQPSLIRFQSNYMSGSSCVP